MSGPAPGGGQRRDRVYLGWQYALLRPDPGPPPRRPVPPEAEQVSPDWVAAQGARRACSTGRTWWR